MWIIKFIVDVFKYPFDKNKDQNKFHQILNFVFKDYPAFLWEKPTLKRFLVFPFLLIFKIFKKG